MTTGVPARDPSAPSVATAREFLADAFRRRPLAYRSELWTRYKRASLSDNRARFDEVSGSVRFDKAAGTGAIDITVQAASVYSGSKGFDEHLRSADLFNVAQHPTLRYVSERLVFDGDTLDEVPGQLTLLGQTHPVTLKASQFKCYPNRRAKTEACGGDFEAVIDRTQWGMNYLVEVGMPKAVRIGATIEAFKQ